MLNTLRFVRGAIAKRELIPVLSHFHVYDGRIQGSNGKIHIDAPCEDLKGFNFTVPAERFLKAVDACDGEPKLKVTAKQKLSISKGSFRALLPLGEHDAFPITKSEGKRVKYKGGLLQCFKTVYNFIGEDASRPWACGCLIRDGYVWATNNAVLIRTPFDGELTELNVPSFAVDELLRIGEEFSTIKVTKNTIEFHYKNGAYLITQLFETNWPDIHKLIPKVIKGKALPENLKTAIEKVVPFCPDPKFPEVLLDEKGVSTADGDMSAQVKNFKFTECRFRSEPLLDVVAIADRIDLTTYPKPCAFIGKNVEGVIIGVRS